MHESLLSSILLIVSQINSYFTSETGAQKFSSEKNTKSIHKSCVAHGRDSLFNTCKYDRPHCRSLTTQVHGFRGRHCIHLGMPLLPNDATMDPRLLRTSGCLQLSITAAQQPMKYLQSSKVDQSSRTLRPCANCFRVVVDGRACSFIKSYTESHHCWLIRSEEMPTSDLIISS